MDSVNIVSKIKSICKSKNIKISALLSEAGLSAHLIDDWQDNKTEPSFPALFKICDVLQINISDLFITGDIQLTQSQMEILTEWRGLSNQEKSAIFSYIDALKSNHK